MDYLFLDLETYYDDVYSLKRMTPLEYALDERFEALGCGFADGGGAKVWVDGPDLPMFFEDVNWQKTWAISHNALFDMVVLAYRYGIVPARYGCTLSMARNQLAHKLKSLSLEKVCEYYGMPAKQVGTLARMKGVNFHQLANDPVLHAEVKAYGLDDVLKCREIFARLLLGRARTTAEADGFPKNELDVIDLVVRMAAVPQFELDGTVLAEHLASVKAHKQALLDAAQITDSNLTPLMSDTQFAQKLWFLGVHNLPRKISKTTGKEQYAFAKTDKAFTDLLEHPKPMVQALVAARLGHKTTIEETRTERLLGISQKITMAPVPLKYSGAHTHRFGGDWKVNLQNLPNASPMRRAFRAPKGKLVVSVDASQIEARLNAVLSAEIDLVEDFRKGVDVYSKFASEDIYHYPVSKANKIERFVGKTGILSLGYGSSAPVFQNMVRVKSDPEQPVILQDHEAVRIVGSYRARFRRIVANWHFANTHVIPRMSIGDDGTGYYDRVEINKYVGFDPRSLIPWGPLIVGQNRIELSNGNRLYYSDLHYVQVGKDEYKWVFKRAAQPIHLYGAKLVENVIQSLAFVHIMEVAVRVYKISQGLLWPAHQVHDELIYVVDESRAEDVGRLVAIEMSRPPVWMPKAPLAAEVHIGPTYGDLK